MCVLTCEMLFSEQLSQEGLSLPSSQSYSDNRTAEQVRICLHAGTEFV